MSSRFNMNFNFRIKNLLMQKLQILILYKNKKLSKIWKREKKISKYYKEQIFK